MKTTYALAVSLISASLQCVGLITLYHITVDAYGETTAMIAGAAVTVFLAVDAIDPVRRSIAAWNSRHASYAQIKPGTTVTVEDGTVLINDTNDNTTPIRCPRSAGEHAMTLTFAVTDYQSHAVASCLECDFNLNLNPDNK